MEKKYVRKFISLFDCLIEAGAILSGKYDENPDEKPVLSSKVSAAFITNLEIINDPDSKFLRKVFDEISDNLYDLSKGKEVYYIKEVLRGFVGIMPYLDPFVNIEWSEPEPDFYLIGDKYFPPNYGATLNLIIEYGERYVNQADELTDVEKYVLSCSELLLIFADNFNVTCLNFDFDLFAIQEELNILILKDINLEMLARSGYEDKARQIVKNLETSQKALPDHLPDEAEEAKVFPQQLDHDNPDALAAICKKVFNVNQSPKEYAVMFCLLSQDGYITIRDRERKPLYESWYTFINKPFPKNGNFSTINKYIQVNAENGFYFNDNDPDFHLLKEKFVQELNKL